jgi:hypothetical protein
MMIHTKRKPASSIENESASLARLENMLWSAISSARSPQERLENIAMLNAKSSVHPLLVVKFASTGSSARSSDRRLPHGCGSIALSAKLRENQDIVPMTSKGIQSQLNTSLAPNQLSLSLSVKKSHNPSSFKSQPANKSY